MFNDIQPYITKDEPFGPIDSGDIEATDLKALLMLFEKHNLIYKNLRSRPLLLGGEVRVKPTTCAAFSSINNMITLSSSVCRVYWRRWHVPFKI
jgi:hypothetical protein